MRRFPGREAGKPLRSAGGLRGRCRSMAAPPFSLIALSLCLEGQGGALSLCSAALEQGKSSAKKSRKERQQHDSCRLSPKGFPIYASSRPASRGGGGPLPIAVYSFRARMIKVWLIKAAQPPEERGSGPDGLPSPAGRRDCSISFSTFRPCCARQLI